MKKLFFIGTPGVAMVASSAFCSALDAPYFAWLFVFLAVAVAYILLLIFESRYESKLWSLLTTGLFIFAAYGPGFLLLFITTSFLTWAVVRLGRMAWQTIDLFKEPARE